MPLMPAEKGPDFTILGPCPGCWVWTLEYDQDVMLEFGNLDAWHEAVEAILQDHLEECSGLREIVEKRS